MRTSAFLRSDTYNFDGGGGGGGARGKLTALSVRGAGPCLAYKIQAIMSGKEIIEYDLNYIRAKIITRLHTRLTRTRRLRDDDLR